MSILYLTSVKGAPGATTAALALGHFWPRPVVLIEADPAGSSILAGFLRGGVDHSRGLSNITLALRSGAPAISALTDQTITVTENLALVPGLADPAQAPTMASVWPHLTTSLRNLEDAGVDVIIDAGRLDAACGPTLLLSVSDVVAVVTRTRLPDVYAVNQRVPALVRDLLADGNGGAVHLLAVGPDRPYSPREIAARVDVPPLPSLAWDPTAAEVFSDGAAPARRFTSSSLARTTQAAVTALDTVMTRRRDLRAMASYSTFGVPGETAHD